MKTLFNAAGTVLAGRLLLAGVRLCGAVSAVPLAHTTDHFGPGNNLPLLTNALQVRQWAQAEAAPEYPVRLVGVVTFYNPAQNELFLQDGTGGVRVRSGSDFGFEAGVGQLLEVRGMAHPGGPVTEVKGTQLTLIGEGPMPPPCRVTEIQLAAGEPCGCWVQVRGVVHTLQLGRHDGLLGLQLTTSGSVVMALLKEYNLEDCRRLVDAEVIIAGVLSPTKTAQPDLRVPFMGDIAVTQTPAADPFKAPAFQIDRLLNPSSTNRSLHRVKVEGLVTLQQPGRAVFIQSGTNHLMAFSEQKTSLQPGDLIELVGFPSMDASNFRLDHANFRKLKKGSQPVPIPMTAEEAATPGRKSALIDVEGELLRRERDPGPVLQLKSANIFFRARLENANREFPNNVREGSRVRLIGICLPLTGITNAQPAFELLLRSPADVLLVKGVSASNTRRLAVLTAIAASLLALGLARRLHRSKRAGPH